MPSSRKRRAASQPEMRRILWVSYSGLIGFLGGLGGLGLSLGVPFWGFFTYKFPRKCAANSELWVLVRSFRFKDSGAVSLLRDRAAYSITAGSIV